MHTGNLSGGQGRERVVGWLLASPLCVVEQAGLGEGRGDAESLRHQQQVVSLAGHETLQLRDRTRQLLLT